MSTSLQQRAYAHIYRKLVNSELVPGDRLSNRALAKEIGVSVIPVREAINQLASKGLLSHQPGLGAFVPQPSGEEYFQLLELREAVECHVAAKLAGRLSQGEISRLEEQNAVLTEIIEELQGTGQVVRSPQQLERWHVADAAFHMALLVAAGNPRLLEIVRDLRLISRIFSRLVEPQPLESLVATRDAHSRIIAALRDGRPQDAREAMAEHIHHRASSMVELFDKTTVRMVPEPDDAMTADVAPAIQERLRDVEIEPATNS